LDAAVDRIGIEGSTCYLHELATSSFSHAFVSDAVFNIVSCSSCLLDSACLSSNKTLFYVHHRILLKQTIHNKDFAALS
jgi:hypothetical protein